MNILNVIFNMILLNDVVKCFSLIRKIEIQLTIS